MESVKTINLIQPQAESSPQAEMVTALFRKVGIIALGVLIFSGIVVGSIYYYFQWRQKQIDALKQEIGRQMTLNTTKEGLLFTTKQRIVQMKKIMEVQHPVGKVFNMVTAFVSPGQIYDISFRDKNTVQVSMNAQSISEIVTVIDAFTQQSEAHGIRDPKLISFSLGDNGKIDVSVSFQASF